MLLACPCSQAEGLERFKKEHLKVLVEGHVFTEGPTLDGQGNILFTSPQQNAVIRYAPGDQTSSVYYQGDDPVSALFYRKGRLFR